MRQSLFVGDIEIHSVADGLLETPLDAVIGMDQEEARTRAGHNGKGPLFISVNNFVFTRGDKVVLIDAGAGNKMQPTLGRLPLNLLARGFEPASITHIILTHLHRDHANGLVDDTGTAIYPNAEVLVHEKEFNFWIRTDEGENNPNVRRIRPQTRMSLSPYLQRLRLMKDGDVFMGCSPILAAGHTPGHTCWRIETGKGACLAWGDLVHFSAIQISRPRVAVKYDMDPELATASRLRIFDMVANDRIAIAGAHVTAPGLGYLVRKGAEYYFEGT
jgi:glyoxylase-like metal-dependent hydrolase (beta-lactamase superfamily II)